MSYRGRQPYPKLPAARDPGNASGSGRHDDRSPSAHTYRSPSDAQPNRRRSNAGAVSEPMDPFSRKRPGNAVRGNSPPEKRSREATGDASNRPEARRDSHDPRPTYGTSRPGNDVAPTIRRLSADGSPLNAILSPTSLHGGLVSTGSGSSTPVQIAPPAPSMLSKTSTSTTATEGALFDLQAVAHAYHSGVTAATHERILKHAAPTTAPTLASLKALQHRKQKESKAEMMKAAHVFTRFTGKKLPPVPPKPASALESADTTLDYPIVPGNNMQTMQSNESKLLQSLQAEIQALKDERVELKKGHETLSHRLTTLEAAKTPGLQTSLIQRQIDDAVQKAVRDEVQQKLQKLREEQPQSHQALNQNIQKTKGEESESHQALKQLIATSKFEAATAAQQSVDKQIQKSEDEQREARQSLIGRVDTIAKKLEDELAKKDQDISNAVGSITKEITGLKNRLSSSSDSMTKDITSLRDRLSTLSTVLSQQIDDMTANERKTYDKTSTLNKDIDDLYELTHRAKERIDRQNATINDLSDEIKDLSGELKATRERTAPRTGTPSTKDASIESRYTNLSSRVSTLEQRPATPVPAKNLKSEIEDCVLSKSKDLISQTDKQLRELVGRLDIDLSKEQERIANISERISMLEQQYIPGVRHHGSVSDEDIASISQRITRNTDSIVKVQQDAGSRADQIDQMKKDIANNAERIASLKEDISSNANQYLAFDQALVDVERKQHELSADMEALQEDIPQLVRNHIDGKLEPYKASLDPRLAAIEGRLQEFGDRFESHSSTISQVSLRSGAQERDREELSALGSQMASLEQQMQSSSASLDELKLFTQRSDADYRSSSQAMQALDQTVRNLGQILQSVRDNNDRFAIAFRSLESRYENISTDKIYQAMANWFQQTYPDQPAIQSKLGELQRKHQQLAEMISDVQSLAPGVRSLAQDMELLKRDYNDKIIANWDRLLGVVDQAKRAESNANQAMTQVDQIRTQLSNYVRQNDLVAVESTWNNKLEKETAARINGDSQRHNDLRDLDGRHQELKGEHEGLKSRVQKLDTHTTKASNETAEIVQQLRKVDEVLDCKDDIKYACGMVPNIIATQGKMMTVIKDINNNSERPLQGLDFDPMRKKK